MVRAKVLVCLTLILVACAHTYEASTDNSFVGAHKYPQSASYVGSPLVTGNVTASELFQKYPSVNPDKRLRSELTKILLDRGETMHWSASASREYFKNGDLKIEAWVRSPPQCKDKLCPVIVEVYGDGGCFTGTYHWRPEFFLRAGFIVVQPNIRGSSCGGPNWRNAAKGEKKFETLTDIRACGLWARQHFARDGQSPKLGIVGWSYGGFVALIGMTRFAGTFDAGYALAAKTDLLSFFRSAPKNLRRARAEEYGDPDRDEERFRRLSPITYVDQVRGPIALMLGGQDPKVSLSDADAFVQKLRNRDQVASLMIVPEHGHLTERPDEITFEHAHIISFFSEKFGYPISFR